MKVEKQAALLLKEIRVRIAETHFPKSKGGRAVLTWMCLTWSFILGLWGLIVLTRI